MKAVVLDKINVSDKYRDDLAGVGVVFHDDLPSADEIKDRIKDAEIAILNHANLTPDIIDAATELRYIIVSAVGYDQVDVAYASARGITTLNCPTFNSQAVAEYAMTLLMAANRNLARGVDGIRAGRWSSDVPAGYELGGKMLGLIGYGNIGSRVEKFATSIGMNVRHVNSKSSSAEVDDLISGSDYLVVSTPLNGSTLNLIDRRRLQLMKRTAVLVNVGRGAVIDQDALYETLKDQRIRGAGLDVFDGEPVGGEPNRAIVELAKLPNVVATPHVAYSTEEIRDKQGVELLENLQSCLRGRPINVVSNRVAS